MRIHDLLRASDLVINGLFASTGIGNRMNIEQMLLENKA